MCEVYFEQEFSFRQNNSFLRKSLFSILIGALGGNCLNDFNKKLRIILSIVEYHRGSGTLVYFGLKSHR